MRRPPHRSLHLLHSRLSSHASKRATHHVSGERTSSLSVTTNGSTLQDTPASKHTFIRTASIQAIEKARNQWYSKPNSSPYSSSSQKVNGRSLRRFGRNVLPHLHKEHPSQPLGLPLHLRLFRRTRSGSLCLFTLKELASTLPYCLNLMPWSDSQSSFSVQPLAFPSFFLRLRRLRHQVVFLNDQFHVMLNVWKLTTL